VDPGDPRHWRIGEYVLVVVFAVYVLYFLTGFRFEALISGDARQVDFRMWYLLPPQIKTQDYPLVITGNWLISFPYLPSAVAMMLPLSLMPQVAAFIVWMILQGLAFVTVIWTSLRLAGLQRSHLRLPIAAAAVFITSTAIEWDLRAHNNNLIYLALVMLALSTRKTWIAAILFAVTANLKLYSGVLIPGFLWRREYRLGLATAVAAPPWPSRCPYWCSVRINRSSCSAVGSTKSSTPPHPPAGPPHRCRCKKPPAPCLVSTLAVQPRWWPRGAANFCGWCWSRVIFWSRLAAIPPTATIPLRGSAMSSCC